MLKILFKTKTINLLFLPAPKACPRLQVQWHRTTETQVAPFTCCSQEGSDSPTWQKSSAHLPFWLPEYISSFTPQLLVNSALMPGTASEPTFACQSVRTWVPSRAAIKTQATTIFSLKSCQIFTASLVRAALLTQVAWYEIWRKYLRRSKPPSFLEKQISFTPFQWYPYTNSHLSFLSKLIGSHNGRSCFTQVFWSTNVMEGQKLGSSNPKLIHNVKGRN